MNKAGRDVDYVLTTRELGRMIKAAGIDFISLADGKWIHPWGSVWAADIRQYWRPWKPRYVRRIKLSPGAHCRRKTCISNRLPDSKGIKDASLLIQGTLPAWSFLEGVELKVAVTHGLSTLAA